MENTPQTEPQNCEVSHKAISKQLKLDPQLFTLFRLDGHGFSKFVKKFNMKLPFDSDFTTSMKNTSIQSFTYYKFFIGFVGSDEITFAMKPLTPQQIKNGSTLEFNGRIQKMVSLLAGKVSTTFFIELTKLAGFQKTKQFCPHFDCRVFQVQTLDDVLKNIADRVTYTLKNSRMMLAQTYYNQKELNKIPSHLAVQKLLKQKQIDYNEVVHGDNRVGNVLVFEKVPQEKEIVVKGETKTVAFERKKVKLLNLGPKQVISLQQKSFQ